eukprot:TRINITY_DN3489_c5_g1_i1.p1 TRINITY_DN3489_c5_g1~~TRINITY_DN3489_c5_g1_i1.p1  ORF type:complete len:116 (+),score=41.61 TRINITY_DN3489_c5_g1_i1:40-348(+)
MDDNNMMSEEAEYEEVEEDLEVEEEGEEEEEDDDDEEEQTVPEPTVDRQLTIYSWGKKLHEEPDCEVTFDVTQFVSPAKCSKRFLEASGTDESIQVCVHISS